LREPKKKFTDKDRDIPGHRNWQIETAVWNLAVFLHCDLETFWQRFGQFPTDFFNDNLTSLYENLYCLYGNLRFSLLKILMIFSMIL